MQTLQAAGAGGENVITVTDVTRETYKTVDSGGVKEYIGKEQDQEAGDKAAASQRSEDKTVTPDKETKDEEIKRPVRLYFFKLVLYRNCKFITHIIFILFMTMKRMKLSSNTEWQFPL